MTILLLITHEAFLFDTLFKIGERSEALRLMKKAASLDPKFQEKVIEFEKSNK